MRNARYDRAYEVEGALAMLQAHVARLENELKLKTWGEQQ
jgi:uncharacterized small protein (DUF1192 family)